MKITRVRLTRLRLPLRRGFATRRQRLATRDSLLLQLENDAGVSGFGEASPLPGFSSESLPEAQKALERTASHLLGEGFSDPQPLCERLGASLHKTPCARAALDLALRDLGGRARGIPLSATLAARLDGAPRTRVAVNALLVEEERSALATTARRALADGFETLKLKLLGPTLDADLRRVAALRDAVGSTPLLRVDANGGFGEHEALEACRALLPYEIEYLEQPVPAADLAALARLRRSSPIPIAADEAAASEGGALAVIRAGAADVLVLKPSLCGGLAAALELVQRARSAGLDFVLTSALESAVGVAGALHLAAALPLPGRACGLATGAWLADDVARLAAPRDGCLPLPLGAGLGIAPDRDAVERLRVGRSWVGSL